MIAQSAKTNLTSIQYHFGNKLGLYRSVAEHVEYKLEERLLPICESARQVLREPFPDRGVMIRMFSDVTVEFAQLLMSEDRSPWWVQFICQEQHRATSISEVIHTSLHPLLELGMEYISKLTDRPIAAPETRIQLMAIVSMVKFTLFDRATVLRVLQRGNYGEEELQIVIRVLLHNIEVMLGGLP
jgi:AcrR family transcriptional regulator